MTNAQDVRRWIWTTIGMVPDDGVQVANGWYTEADYDALLAQHRALEEKYETAVRHWAEDDTEVEQVFLDAGFSEGNEHGDYKGVLTLAKEAVAKIKALEAENRQLVSQIWNRGPSLDV